MSIRTIHSVCACAILAVLGLASAAAAETVSMLRSIGFSETSTVRQAVRDECQVQTRLPEFIQSFAQGQGVTVELVDSLPASGRVLEVEVAETVELGNAFSGRQKGYVITGTLKQDGEVVGSFRGRRTTGGGMWGGYKGTCSFFARCSKAHGKDVGAWLANPSMNASIGGW